MIVTVNGEQPEVVTVKATVGFGRTMIFGGIKAVLHGFFPNIFQTSGSDTVRGLHAILVEKRSAKRDAITEMNTVEWMI